MKRLREFFDARRLARERLILLQRVLLTADASWRYGGAPEWVGTMLGVENHVVDAGVKRWEREQRQRELG